jgi:hypothetical protein
MLQDEVGLAFSEGFSRRARVKRIRKSVLGACGQPRSTEASTHAAGIDRARTHPLSGAFAERLANLGLTRGAAAGDWKEVEQQITSKQPHALKDAKSLLYRVYRQQFLEFIDSGEISKALSILEKKLKPSEHLCGSHQEFADMCYLLTCRCAPVVASSLRHVPTAAAQVCAAVTVLSGLAGRGKLEVSTSPRPTSRRPSARILPMQGKACRLLPERALRLQRQRRHGNE